MPNNRLTVDRPFAEQPTAKEILKHSKYLVPKALITKATLSKIHGLAKQLIIDELGPEKEIIRLRLGYYAPLIESKKVGQLYSFEPPGKLPIADKNHSDNKRNIERETLSSEFISQLSQRIREEIIRQTPPIALESRVLHINFLLEVKNFNPVRQPLVKPSSGVLESSESSESIGSDSELSESSESSEPSEPSEMIDNDSPWIEEYTNCPDPNDPMAPGCEGEIIDGECVCLEKQ